MRLCSSCFVSLMYKSGHSSLHWTVYTILLCVLVLDPLGAIVLVCWKVWNIWGHCVCWKSSRGFQILQSFAVQKDDAVFVLLAFLSGVSSSVFFVSTVYHIGFWSNLGIFSFVVFWWPMLKTHVNIFDENNLRLFCMRWWWSQKQSSSEWLEIMDNWVNRAGGSTMRQGFQTMCHNPGLVNISIKNAHFI